MQLSNENDTLCSQNYSLKRWSRG